MCSGGLIRRVLIRVRLCIECLQGSVTAAIFLQQIENISFFLINSIPPNQAFPCSVADAGFGVSNGAFALIAFRDSGSGFFGTLFEPDSFTSFLEKRT